MLVEVGQVGKELTHISQACEFNFCCQH